MRGCEAGSHVPGRRQPRAAGAAAARGARRGRGATRLGRRHHGRQRQARGAPRHAAPQARRQGTTTALADLSDINPDEFESEVLPSVHT